MVRKYAFTLIELVFAIVIIGISVVSLPMMNQAVSKGVDSNLVQEAIFGASTKLNDSVSSHWDENSLEPTELDTLARVIDDGTCENNASLTTVRQKQGHIHRRCLDSSATAPDDGADTTTLVDDLNDIATGKIKMTTENTTTAVGYKKLYQISIAVKRKVSFGETTNNPNLKRIKVDVYKKQDGKLLTSLKSFSANIGEVDFNKRTF